MSEKRLYTEDEVIGILVNLANGIGLCAKGDVMSSRYKQEMEIGGQKHWVTGRTLKDLLEAYLKLCIEQGTVMPGFIAKAEEEGPKVPKFGEYLQEFNRLYKVKQENSTKVNRDRTIRNHILPKFGEMRINEITVPMLQEWFNQLDQEGYSHETLLKLRNLMNPALNSAVEDGYIPRNPLESSRIVIRGKETIHHKAIPAEKMKEIRDRISEISDIRMRAMLALLCYTGMRFEEILGLKWEDIDFEAWWIYIRRAVVHPTRNMPEVKAPKTKTSARRIPLPDILKKHLAPKFASGYVLYTTSDPKMETPLSFTESRRMFAKIRDDFGFEGYSAHDFRDTCATEWRESGVPIDVIAHLLGHSKSDITENRYVKYRDELYQGVRVIMNGQ